jgi:nucleotide-binding universal stress UspA family protein
VKEMSLFPTRILLATDGSTEAGYALGAAVELAEGTGSDLHVVTVGRDWPAHVAIEHGAYYEPALEAAKSEAREILDEQLRGVEAAGGTIAKAYLRIGRPDREIVELAEEVGAGLIALGSRGLEGIARALMGSVSASVVRHAHCPVLVVREQRPTGFGPEKILLATDGSEEAELAARTAMDLAAVLGSELHVVTVGHAETPATAALEWVKYRAESVLDRQVARIREAGGEVAGVHLKMSEKRDEEIVVLAEDLGAGLIVLGSRGLGALRRALMGSISDSVVRHAHCPVLVVRPTRDATDEPGSSPASLAADS